MTNKPELTPPEDCICASFWTVRQQHKFVCPLGKPELAELMPLIGQVLKKSSATYDRSVIRDLAQLFETELSKRVEEAENVLRLPIPYELAHNPNDTWVAYWQAHIPTPGLPGRIMGESSSSPIKAVQRLREKAEECGLLSPQKTNDKQVLCAPGHSETRLVHYVSEHDGSYCYTELVEGESDMHFLRIANSYDDGFGDWKPLQTQDSSKAVGREEES